VNQPNYNHSLPIVNASGGSSDAFRKWMATTQLGTPIIGDGSPEGVVEARQFQLYINESGTTGSLLYVKVNPDVGGDRTQGWIAV